MTNVLLRPTCLDPVAVDPVSVTPRALLTRSAMLRLDSASVSLEPMAVSVRNVCQDTGDFPTVVPAIAMGIPTTVTPRLESVWAVRIKPQATPVIGV